MRFVKGLANTWWHMFLTWIAYVLTISPFGNPWQNHNKQMNILVEYNKIYPNTNSWKTLQEESLWQVHFDNLYFWNTLNKTHHGILVWNRNNRLHTLNKKHVYKERKRNNTWRDRWNNIHQNIYKPNISTMYVKWSQDQCTRRRK